MSSEHVEVLWAMLRKCVNERLARKSADREADALAAAIAALSAPQPPAEAQPRRGDLLREAIKLIRRQPESIDRNSLEHTVRLLAAPPSAPVGVEDESVRVGNLPTMNQDGYPGLGEWWVQLWRGDEIIARVYGEGPNEARSQAQDIADALNQQPAAVDEAMVDRAMDAAMEIKHNKETWFPMTRRRMKRALKAALAAQQGGSDNDR